MRLLLCVTFDLWCQQVELESVKIEYANAQLECNAADERAKLLASEVIGLEEKVVKFIGMFRFLLLLFKKKMSFHAIFIQQQPSFSPKFLGSAMDL